MCQGTRNMLATLQVSQQKQLQARAGQQESPVHQVRGGFMPSIVPKAKHQGAHPALLLVSSALAMLRSSNAFHGCL